jgi:hypothetical protein
MRAHRPKLGIILFAAGAALACCRKLRADDWIFYGASFQAETSSTLKDWYGLNRLPLVEKDKGNTYHFYDQDSLAASSPLPGSITRIWEKSVVQRETKNYFETKKEIEQEGEKKLQRKITALDQGWIFPLAVKRATKETHTLFEINCGTGEFIILEVNHYDRDGNRMSRETNMDRETWHAIEPGTIMEALSQQICR